MDKLNSFCVIVLERGCTIFWSKPADADTASKLFYERCRLHVKANGKQSGSFLYMPRSEDGYPAHEDDGGKIYGCSNAEIKERLRGYSGPIPFIQFLASTVFRSYKNAGMEVKLIHSSKS